MKQKIINIVKKHSVFLFGLIGGLVLVVIGSFMFNETQSSERFIISDNYREEKANKLQEKGSYNKAEDIYKVELKKTQDPINYYYLGETIYNSCVNDSDPKLVEALNYYQQAIDNGYIDAGIRVADIYNFCNLPEAGIPNKELAKGIYEKLTREGQDSSVKMQCAIKFSELTAELNQVNIRTDGNRYQQNTNRGNGVNIAHRDQLRDQRNQTRRNLQTQLRRIVPQNNAPRRIPRRTLNRIRNDSQNVHDSGIQRHIKHTIDQLRTLSRYNQYASNTKKTISEVKEAIKNANVLKAKKTKAIKALGVMDKDNSLIVNVGMRESEILSMVWNRFHARENKKNINNLKENLVDQLSDCIVGGNSVCPQGRVSRVIASLQKADANSQLGELKPTWATQQELQQLVAKVRQDTLSNAKEREVEAYNQGIETPEAELITNRIKKNIQEKVIQEYQIPGILTKPEIDKQLKPLLAEI